MRKKKNYIFWTYGSKVMGVWSFKEKSGQGGHVLEPTNKSWPFAQKVEGKKKKKFKKTGNCPTSPGVDRWMRVDTCACVVVHFFLKFFYFKRKIIFGSLGDGPGLLGDRCTTPPYFQALPLHLEVLILQKFMESEDFIFFYNSFFLNLVHTWTFISTIGIFVSWKI